MRRANFIKLSAMILGVAATAVPAVAHAEVDSKTAAEILFDKGRVLIQEKRFGEACPKLEESLRLDRALGTLLWLADCHEHEDKLALAWQQFTDAAALASQTSDSRETVARRRALLIAERLPKVMVTRAADAPGLEIRRDGILITEADLGIATPLDVGSHVIEAKAPGREPWSKTIEVQSYPDEIRVVVPELLRTQNAAAIEVVAANGAAGAATAAAEGAGEGTEAKPEETGAPAPEDKQASKPNVQKIVGLSLVGLGAVGMVSGIVLGLSAKSTYADSNANGHCLANNECDAIGKGYRSDATGLAGGATAAFGLGAAFVVGGLVTYFTAPTVAKTGIAVVPVMSAREGGVVLRRSF